MSFRNADLRGVHHRGFEMRILLVDDEPLLLKSISRYLGGVCGHEILCASGGGEALAQLEAGEAIDVVFCDLKMSDIDGVQVHRAISEHHPELCRRFVFLTGGVTDEATEDYLQNSGALILSKPIRQATFDKVLADLGGA
jgi:CheY-like chemotaxis protein